MSDSNNTTPTGGEPPVPPVPPPGGYQQPPAPSYTPPPAPAYQPQTAPPQSAPAQHPGYGQQPPQGGGYGQQPPAQQPYYGYQAPAAPPTNTLAIVTIILAFLFSVAGIVTGHIALKQIDRTGESGRGLAKAGLILSYVFTGLGLLAVIAYIVFFIFIFAVAGTGTYYSY
ncbi:DUF4190 domain-containing protein [Herbiconiux sp. A18JL235]|uniref:DUF4190 domain-containing protein n=1 Tax=Herbiconiux sp. A18JL235 TaxID=3152363 RepID=A0AB39BEU5_9MICO